MWWHQRFAPGGDRDPVFGAELQEGRHLGAGPGSDHGQRSYRCGPESLVVVEIVARLLSGLDQVRVEAGLQKLDDVAHRGSIGGESHGGSERPRSHGTPTSDGRCLDESRSRHRVPRPPSQRARHWSGPTSPRVPGSRSPRSGATPQASGRRSMSSSEAIRSASFRAEYMAKITVPSVVTTTTRRRGSGLFRRRISGVGIRAPSKSQRGGTVYTSSSCSRGRSTAVW